MNDDADASDWLENQLRLSLRFLSCEIDSVYDGLGGFSI
jgi:hypothetical protein